MNQQIPSSQPGSPDQPINRSTDQPSSLARDPDEINLLEYAYVLVHNKWWIIGLTILGMVVGYVAAVIKGPTYVAEAVIAPKEVESQKGPNLSSLGALGGLVASQLSLGGNASLDKIQIVLDSREFNASLVEKYGMERDVIKFGAPKTFGKVWDAKKGAWKSGFILPQRIPMGLLYKNSFVGTEPKSPNMITVSVKTPDSTFSDSAIARNLAFLDEYLRRSVQKEANENVAYLNGQLEIIADPLLREKLQNLIAGEIEKEMLVSKEAFRVIDAPYRHKEFKQKRLFPAVFGAGFFFLAVFLIIVLHVFSSTPRNSEDLVLIQKIREELFLTAR